MRTGPLAHPKRKLNPALRSAYREAMRARAPSGSQLALISGFTHQSAMSATLHALRITASPLVVGRLQRLAECVHYAGPVFLDEPGGEA